MSGPFEAIVVERDPRRPNPLGAYMEESAHALLTDTLGLHPGEVVVDIGADTGRLARYLVQHASVNIIATEHSPSLRSLGQKRSEGFPIEWREGAPDNVPVEDASADAALLFTTLEFVHDPQPVVAEARRVLRPGGRLVVGVLGALSPWAALYRHLGKHGVSPWTHARLWTLEELARLLDVPEGDVRGGVYLASGAQPPYEEADAAGQRAGNHPAYLVARYERRMSSENVSNE